MHMCYHYFFFNLEGAIGLKSQRLQLWVVLKLKQRVKKPYMGGGAGYNPPSPPPGPYWVKARLVFMSGCSVASETLARRSLPPFFSGEINAGQLSKTAKNCKIKSLKYFYLTSFFTLKCTLCFQSIRQIFVYAYFFLPIVHVLFLMIIFLLISFFPLYIII